MRTMTIQVGDTIPSTTLKRLGANGMEEVNTDDIFKGRRVVVFGVPGAFTPTCSNRHLPGFIDQSGAIRGKGVDEIVCLSVNDPFVMDAWGKQSGAGGNVTMLADGNAELTRKLGLEMDATGFGLGTRSKRFAMVVDDGKVTSLSVEPGPGLEVSSAERILEVL
jgi:peroxiredoxin